MTDKNNSNSNNNKAYQLMMSRTSLVSPKQSVLRIMTDAADLTDSMEHDVSSMFKWHSAFSYWMLAGHTE